MHYNIVYL